eukprot:UN01055
MFWIGTKNSKKVKNTDVRLLSRKVFIKHEAGLQRLVKIF